MLASKLKMTWKSKLRKLIRDIWNAQPRSSLASSGFNQLVSFNINFTFLFHWLDPKFCRIKMKMHFCLVHSFVQTLSHPYQLTHLKMAFLTPFMQGKSLCHRTVYYYFSCNLLTKSLTSTPVSIFLLLFSQ